MWRVSSCFVNVVILEPVLSMHYINKYRHLKVEFLMFLQLLNFQHYRAVHNEHTLQESTYRIMACCILVVFCVHPSFGPEHIQCSWGSHLYQDHLVPILGLSILDKKIILKLVVRKYDALYWQKCKRDFKATILVVLYSPFGK
jgi:hypothetical protein